jgi:hypothetical protein
MGGGGGSKTSASIPGFLRPYVKDLLNRGQAASYKVSDQPFSGNFYAPAQQSEFDAANMTQQVGRSLGSNSGQGLIDLGQATARGDYLSPGSNPYLQANLDTLRNEGMKNFADYSKAATSRSIGGGAYGGDRGQLAQATLGADTERAIQDQQSNVLLKNYMAERQLQQGAGQLITQGAGINALGGELLGAGGKQQRSLEQIARDEELAKFNEANAAPFRGLDQYANLVYGSSGSFLNSKAKGGGGTSLGDIFGGLLGTAAIGSLFT